MPTHSIEIGRAEDAPADDLVIPFAVEGAGVRGRVVRMGIAIDDVLNRHGYPAPVSRLLGEAVLLAAMIGTALKLEGRFTLQTSSDGPVDFLVADLTKDGDVRAYAHFDADRIAALNAEERDSLHALVGSGHMALTVDQGPRRNSYQGVVPLEGTTLAECAHAYFDRSEQIPTRIKLVVAEMFERGAEGEAATGRPSGHWRAGGIMIQHMPAEGGRPRDIDPGDAPEGFRRREREEEDDNWDRARMLMETVEDVELVDPGLAAERLLYRLYHEDGVRTFTAHPLAFGCHCSRDYVANVLDSFGAEEVGDMVEDDGRIRVKCEFCSTSYEFDPSEIARKR